jgi:hypothetical protein
MAVNLHVSEPLARHPEDFTILIKGQTSFESGDVTLESLRALQI